MLEVVGVAMAVELQKECRDCRRNSGDASGFEFCEWQVKPYLVRLSDREQSKWLDSADIVMVKMIHVYLSFQTKIPRF